MNGAGVGEKSPNTLTFTTKEGGESLAMTSCGWCNMSVSGWGDEFMCVLVSGSGSESVRRKCHFYGIISMGLLDIL